MPRTRAVFGHVFRVPPRPGQPEAAYDLDFVEVEDRLAKDVLEVRIDDDIPIEELVEMQRKALDPSQSPPREIRTVRDAAGAVGGP